MSAGTRVDRFELSFDGEAGRIVRGRVETPAGGRAPRAPYVLILHGFKGFMDWGFFPEVSRRLAEAGFVAVSYNTSGSGIGADLQSFTEEEAFARNTFSRQLEDLERVRTFLAEGPSGPGADGPWGLLGHSMGGGVALLEAARADDCDAVVTWSSISTVQRYDEATVALWKRVGHIAVPNARTGQVLRLDRSWVDDVEANREALDVLAACRRLAAPVLVVHGTADESVPFAEAERLGEALPPDRSALLPLEGAGHTFGAVHPFAGATRSLERAIEATLDHFRAHLAS